MANGKAGPLYREIAAWLEHQITTGALGPGDMVDSEAELCKRFDVSRITVRGALKELEQKGIIERIPGKGTFVSAPVRPQAQQERPSVAFIINRASSGFAWDFLVGAQEALEEAGYSLTVANARDDEGEELRLVRRFEQDPAVKGLLLMGLGEGRDRDAVAHLVASRAPFVLVDHFMPEFDTDAVISDDYGGAYEVTRHLLDRGHRRIGLVSAYSVRTSSVAERIAGFRQALQEARVPLAHAPSLTLEPGPDDADSEAHRQEALQRWLVEHPELSAVVALSDFEARLVLRAARQVGRNVPQDLALTGFGDWLAASLEPPLTSVAMDRTGLGREAVRLLLSRVATPQGARRRAVLATRLVTRESTPAIHEV